MAKKADSKTQPESEVLLELNRLDVGSAVALVGHPIHVMMVHFPIAFVVATLGIDVIYWWSGDPFWVRAGLWSAGFAFWSGAAWLAALPLRRNSIPDSVTPSRPTPWACCSRRSFET